MTSVVVIGPNLLKQDHSFHVHAAGCADIKRSPVYRSREFDGDKNSPMDFNSETEVIEFVYSDFIDNDNPADNFSGDFNFFPCVRFAAPVTPVPEKEKAMEFDTRTVTSLRRITFEVYNKKQSVWFEAELKVPYADLEQTLSELRAMPNTRNIQY
jgi:hypothetical protein